MSELRASIYLPVDSDSRSRPVCGGRQSVARDRIFNEDEGVGAAQILVEGLDVFDGAVAPKCRTVPASRAQAGAHGPPNEGGSSELDERRFAVVALVTLKPVLIDARSGRFDARNHHLASTSWTFRPVDGWKPKENKQVLEHGLLV